MTDRVLDEPFRPMYVDTFRGTLGYGRAYGEHSFNGKPYPPFFSDKARGNGGVVSFSQTVKSRHIPPRPRPFESSKKQREADLIPEGA